MLATGTATDPLGASDSDALTVSAGGATGIRSVRSSFFANRVNWGNSITETTQGPESTPDPYVHLAGPWTLGFQVQAIADCRSVGIRVMKMPAGHGTITALCWSSTGVLQASTTASWSADGGGWREFYWNTPVDLISGATYYFGYHYPSTDQNWALNTYVWNNGQDTCVYPLLVLGTSGPTFYKAGATPTWTGLSTDHNYHNVYVDPIMEWDTDIPGYTAGTSYYAQFPNGGSRFAFPCAIDFADPQNLAGYAALGMNTLVVSDAARADIIAAVKAADMDWYPQLHGNNLAGPQLVADDSDAAEQIRGYFLTDEPEFSSDTPPSTVRPWRNNARRIDSTRPIYINLGRMIIENQGFGWKPAGISAKDVNLQWREYLSLADICSMDGYGIEHSFPFTFQGSLDTDRYGIWIYPLQIHRMRTEMTDGRVPIWGEVETTSAYPSSPTPTNVRKAVWSMLIAGAKGMIYFDHRFAGPAVSQDFAAMLSDSAMSTVITALNAQMISLAAALNADETNYIVSATAAGTMAAAQGGYPSGAKIPMHYSTRAASGTYYFFIQSIRDGSAGTVTVTVPGFESVVLTVIGESRTVTVSSGGVFTDTFTGDYEYHLYSTTTAPNYSVPANTVAPAITDDGTPETGEIVTCSTGTWTGVPTPTYSYSWQRNTGSGFTPIIGSAGSAYTLQVGDEGFTVRCVVTATNSQGVVTANSNSISPTAAAPSAYEATVLADTPVAFWRLADLTDTSGNTHTLTNNATGTVGFVASLITDPADGAVSFSSGAETETLYVADHAHLRFQSTYSIELWFTGDGAITGSGGLLHNDGNYVIRALSGHIQAFVYTGSGGSDWWLITSAATITTNTRHHVVVTFDTADNKHKLYLDGALDTTYSGTITTEPLGIAGQLCIGKDLGSGGAGGAGTSGWVGTIDEVALYATALTSTQITQHYTDGTA